VTNFANFRAMEPETKDLVLDFMKNADRQRSAFMSFVNIWMAFNGWMAAVTEWESDADMIRALATNNRLIATYTKRQPSAWTAGDTPAWEQLLRTIYQVRCNLVHGEKSPQSARDRQLILKSDRILRAFLAETGCFEWRE
jgi:hypothetical protein